MAAHDGSFQVFINFRGEDTRNNFTGFLHSALKRERIDAFMDSENLWGGEEIKTALLQAIQGSKISIPVFSKGYADSKWCLVELAEMVRCHKSNGQIILPIFFDVEITDVRHQSGSFKASFENHEKSNDAQTLKSWREALNLVTGISGHELKLVYGNQSKLVNKIVEWALTKLNSPCLPDVKNPIGLDAHVKKIEDLLNADSDDVEFVGIWGMSGIGKTAIAKAFFNSKLKEFPTNCFLENTREEASKGLVHLQKLLIQDITKNEVKYINNVDRGKAFIREKLRGEKVLLIIDDVDSHDQLDALAIEFKWFDRRSIIIITSQDEHILNLAKVDKAKRYRPKELDDKQSLQLFSLHAFSTNKPPEDYEQLCHEVLRLAGGLPLTLEVWGSYLYGTTEKQEWESMLRSLKNIPHKDIQKKLKISYDHLESDERSIFLDAVCFFIGWRKDTIISMWEACGFEAKAAIHKLTQRSLLKFTNKEYVAYKYTMGCNMELRKQSYEELRMHDQIQAMGRRIIIEESLGKLRNCSRLLSSDHIPEVFEEQMETPMIEGIFLPTNEFSRNVCLDREKVFAKMSELRFLCINGANSEVLPQLPYNLRWFSWTGCSLKILPTNFYHKKLVQMDLSGSQIKKAWTNKPRSERFLKLKVLILRDCKDLLESPDFSWFPYLEKVNLSNCQKMVSLHNSIGDLKFLVELYLDNTNIKELPESICRLNSLKRLNVAHLRQPLGKLPASIGDLKSLVDLDLSSAKLEEIPNNIWKLSSLERLYLDLSKSMKKLPESIDDLKSLVDLEVYGDCIEELPNSTCMLNSLKMLGIFSSSLKKLPDNLCNLNSLVSLVLRVKSHSLESLPKLPSTLTHLSIEARISFQKTDFSNLKKLRILKLGYCYDIEGLEEAENLEKFYLFNSKTDSLSKLPSNLTTLDVSTSISRLPDLSSLKKLRILKLCDCEINEIQGLEGTESLEEFRLSKCDSIRLPELPSTLTHIEVLNCKSLWKFPDLSGQKYLSTLKLQGSKELEKIQGLEGVESLTKFHVDHCNTVTDTRRKILGQGTLLVDELQRNDSLNVNDGIYKGLILCLVFAFPLESKKMLDYEGQPAIVNLNSEAIISSKHRRIECLFKLQIKDVKYTSKRDIIYIHHFDGFDWFGFPLKGKDANEKISFSAEGNIKIPCTNKSKNIDVSCEVKFWKLLLESTESKKQIPSPECSARMVADFFSWSFDNDGRSLFDTGEKVHIVSYPFSHGDGEYDNEESSFLLLFLLLLVLLLHLLLFFFW
ncbi:hypothetical protein NE237_032184 [Protea cynaroides]|uniref:ADP-ribosyl cyclase/cyclic ADP-ribose hydrolase n=1 Tax=Protea cynaroides TaxID=273540 RepID=A0A9Q0L2V3_9MAGN|nr:hypothetical protein NE237_032184 [Protea cynaroides]